jgi:Uma2 family endonuclease
MTIASQFTPIAPTSLWRLSVQQYHQMREQGILTEVDTIELLDGLLVEKMPKNPPHRIATRLVRDVLENLNLSGWYVETQEPITLSNSEPEPDVAVIRGNTMDYSDRHPGADDVVLVIEVADSTLERDRTIKQKIYAKAGIANFWILNLVDRVLEVYVQPQDETYQSQRTIPSNAVVTLMIDQQYTIAVADLLP